MSVAMQTVSFHGDELQAVREGECVWVLVKRVCEVLGIDDFTQARKLKEKPWATTSTVLAVAEDGRTRELFCVDLKALPMWLATVDATRVDESKREKLIAYQCECARVLHNHFFGQPAAPEPLKFKSPAREGLELANDLLIGLGVHPGIAAAAVMRDAETSMGITLTHAAKALPAVTEDLGGMNATELGELLGTTAVKANKRLETAGLQVRDGKQWALTELGKKHADAFPFVRNGHPGLQIKWRDSVVAVLRSAL